jgi:hypothetical protein
MYLQYNLTQNVKLRNINQKNQSTIPTAQNKKGIDNHIQAAKHLEEASKHHLDTAKHHEVGNHDKASASTLKTQGHTCLANECQKEDVKHHALNN